MSSAKQNLLDYDKAALTELFATLGQPRYRVDQLIKWIHSHGVLEFDAMSNFSKSLRESLNQQFEIRLPEVVHEQVSQDGTTKWLLRFEDGNCIETVFIPEDNRGTLCVSSQVGCALNCSFCATARQGFSRNLSLSEVIGQVWIASRAKDVSNVVMMGMGEPLMNFDTVVTAMDLMMDDHAYGLSKYRVTLSTSGVVPHMEKLSQCSAASLAVSLHAPIDELRNILVPINKKYPLDQLMQVCRNYFQNDKKRKITFEYVMLDGMNDSEQHAQNLVKLLEGIPCKVNLIPFNPFPNAGYKCSSAKTIDRFRDKLSAAGIVTTTRKTRGDDIDAACGQLVGKVNDRTKRSELWRKKELADA